LQELNPQTISSDITLYNLACCLSVATRYIASEAPESRSFRSDALRFFIWACIRNEGWWSEVQVDPDLSAIDCQIEVIRGGVSELGKRSLQNSEFSALELRRVDDAVRTVIETSTRGEAT
jgi:hypothetical protein